MTCRIRTHDTAIKWIPASNLRACLKYIREPERDNTKYRIMLSISLISNSDCEDSGSPISNEFLGTGVEDWLAAHCFCTCAVHLIRLST